MRLAGRAPSARTAGRLPPVILNAGAHRRPQSPPQVQAAGSPLCSSSRRFLAFGDPSVARVDAVLAKTGLMGVESTVPAPKMRRLEAHKHAGGPKIVDSTVLRPLMCLASTAESRLEPLSSHRAGLPSRTPPRDPTPKPPRRHALARGCGSAGAFPLPRPPIACTAASRAGWEIVLPAD